MVNKCIVLFSGTKSIEKVFEKNNWECRGVDIDNHFKPFYNVDILKWDYKTDLENFIPDYLHSSPVCKNYTPLKNKDRKIGKMDKDLEFSLSLVNKTIEIIEWIKTKNPKLKFTIENPKGFMRSLEVMTPYNRITTSYCKYGYPYQKDTDFWYGGFDLKLKERCCKKERCNQLVDGKSFHKVRIGYTGSFGKDGKKVIYEGQLIDGKYFTELRKQEEYKNYNNTYLRYRIPCCLIEDIYKSVNC